MARKPKYAVLISGAWGSGKTFLVRDHLKGKASVLSISANGVATTRALIERLYLAAYPVLADKTLRALGSLTKTVAGAFRVQSDLKIDDLFDLDKINTIIVDDIERSKIPIEELFGFLNEFVEHDDKHLILIGHEDEVLEKERYAQIKEKVVGFTIEVEPDYRSVLSKLTQAGSDYDLFVMENKLRFLEIFREGELRNLRIIENALEDAESVFQECQSSGISDPHLSGVYFPFFLLAYHFRKGDITKEDIERRQPDSFTRAFLKSKEDFEPEGVEKFDQYYTNVDLLTSDIDNDFLVAKLCEGREASEFLRRTLGDIKGRSDPESNPEWRNLWYYLHQDDDVIKSSFDRMMKKFDKRKYTDAGEILHVFGLLYEMRNLGLLAMEKADIEKSCAEYLDDLLASSTLPLLENDYLGGFRHGAAHGLGFTNANEPGFKRLYSYFRKRSDEWRDVSIKAELEDIFLAANFDVDMFRAIILQGERGDNVYSRPFMHILDPKTFVTAILAENAETQFEILYALRGRYDQSPYPEIRKFAAAWLRKVIDGLRKAPKSEITRKRLNKVLNMTIIEPSKVMQ
ncbi:hypothetical protein QQS45_10110 [Alteriqipengyuania flavescens]|uniref:hypothetical protein n=1 Tax=Alteriqipengyuania flavescens TaxID=3053610 RepID=UPI0025B38C9F|nr:hypothetical protein [Alteriqipengyuania flavescens]WJY17977.1 hypothetical protein QQW98_10105 [Alteriqipengyuania flavescens]WJY23918.1 hypothetical protein QQS45_10110 [Alteriqipengyuania flavescens]